MAKFPIKLAKILYSVNQKEKAFDAISLHFKNQKFEAFDLESTRHTKRLAANIPMRKQISTIKIK